MVCDNCTIIGNRNVVIGNNNQVVGAENAIFGDNNIVEGSDCAVCGNFNNVIGEKHAVVGNENARKASAAAALYHVTTMIPSELANARRGRIPIGPAPIPTPPARKTSKTIRKIHK
jgi:hypothetical protein